MERETTMAKVNSQRKRIAPWQQLHHWQGLALVLLMLPLGSSMILGSVLLENANRQGLPEDAWALELGPNMGDWLGDAMAQLPGIGASRSAQQVASLAEAPRLLPLKRRQRRAVQTELKTLSRQIQQRLEIAIAPISAPPLQSSSTSYNNSPPSSPLPKLPVPDLRQSPHEPASPAAAGSSINEYSPAVIADFFAIALGTEYSPTGHISRPHIRKWVQDLRIQVNGSPTIQDLATLEQVVAEINGLLGSVALGFVEQDPNLEIFFVPERDFSRFETSYQPVNHGFFASESHQGKIQRGRILISTTDIGQGERSHLIREELTQSLGLMQDSSRDSTSIFYQDWSKTQQYSDLDRQLLQLLYSPKILPGMDESALRRVLQGTER